MLGKQVGKSSGVEGFPATDHTEIEWQFDADELEPVEDWLGRHPSSTTDLIVAPESTVEITDANYDTDDWRLYRAGFALRVRETYGEVEATMKSLTPAEGSLRERREISEPLKALQDDLGDHQDTIVASEYLRELGTTTGGTRVPRNVAFTMGVYSERCSREARDLRSTIPDSKPFRALKKGKRWKKFERVLKDRNSADAPGKRVR
jgi:hypothetical protein